MGTAPWLTVDALDDPTSVYGPLVVLAASDLLYRLSGEKYGGIRQTTEVYICEHDSPVVYESGALRVESGVFRYSGYNYLSTTVVDHPRPGNGSTSNQFRLRGRPVRSITSVAVGVSATPLDPSQYVLRNEALLAATPGASWGFCGSQGLVVSYTYGVTPPASGVNAARVLANQLVQAAGGGNCALPSNVTSVARQGLQFEMFDPSQLLDKGRTGIFEVDLFLRAVNPANATKPSRVFSPDLPRGYRS